MAVYPLIPKTIQLPQVDVKYSYHKSTWNTAICYTATRYATKESFAPSLTSCVTVRLYVARETNTEIGGW